MSAVDSELRRVLLETRKLLDREGREAWARRFPNGVSDEILTETAVEGEAVLDVAIWALKLGGE